jgi:hypothetical protein
MSGVIADCVDEWWFGKQGRITKIHDRLLLENFTFIMTARVRRIALVFCSLPVPLDERR